MANVKNVAPGVGLCAAIAHPLLVSRRGAARGGRPGVRHPHRHGHRPLVEAARARQPCRTASAFTAKKVLQYAVILLGFGLNLRADRRRWAPTSLPIIRLHHRHLPDRGLCPLPGCCTCRANIATLIGVGSSICGGSAIAATAPVIGADDEEIAQSISVIFLFNVLAALIFPTLGGVFGPVQRGLRPVRRHRGERHLLRHRRRLRLGRHASRRERRWTTPPS